QLPVHVECDDLTGAKPRVDQLPVAHRARAGEVVLVVHAGQRPGCLAAVLPQPAAVGAIERLDDEESAIAGDAARERALARHACAGALRESRMTARAADSGALLRGTKTRSADTIGDDTPTPPIAAFQAMFSDALQRTGKFFS